MDSLRWVLDEEFSEVTCYSNVVGMLPRPGYSDEHGFAAALFRTGTRDPWFEGDTNTYSATKETANSIAYGHIFLHIWAQEHR